MRPTADGSPTTNVRPTADMRLTADMSLRTFGDGRVLIGGSPLRAMRLSPAGARLVAGWLDGKPVRPDPSHRKLARSLVRAGIAHPRYSHSRLSAKDVTAVVPVRDRPEGLPQLRQSLRGLAGILVVDDGSTLPVPGAAVRHAAARGPAAARNTGARAVATELTVFLDADVMPQSGWLEPLLRHFEDPEVVAVAPRVRSRPGRTVLARYERVRSPLDLGAAPAEVRPGSRVSYVPTAALVIRTDVLRERGGCDERLRYGEDVDLIWRLTAAGHRIRYEPGSEVLHAPRGDWLAWLRQRFCYGTSAAPLALRHGPAVAPARLSPWSALSWSAAIAGRPRTGLTVAVATAALLPRRLAATGVPAAEALSLALRGHLGAGRILGEAAVRTWWPVAVPLLLTSRTGRVALALALAARLRGRDKALDPARWCAAAVADDLAYGAGVWWGALRHRTVAPLLPELAGRPGRDRAGR